MTSGVPGVLVCLHDIKLWTSVSTDIVSITVLEGVFFVGLLWHRDRVEGSDTATTLLGDVDIVLDAATYKAWHEVGRSVESVVPGEVHPVVVIEAKIAARCLGVGPVRVLNVECGVDSVKVYLD